MNTGSIIFVGVVAIGCMTLYHLIPFLIVRGASESLAQLRPFLLAGSVLSIALGFHQWRKQSRVPASRLSVVVFCVSSVAAFGMILFPETIANILASALGD